MLGNRWIFSRHSFQLRKNFQFIVDGQCVRYFLELDYFWIARSLNNQSYSIVTLFSKFFCHSNMRLCGKGYDMFRLKMSGRFCVNEWVSGIFWTEPLTEINQFSVSCGKWKIEFMFNRNAICFFCYTLFIQVRNCKIGFLFYSNSQKEKSILYHDLGGVISVDFSKFRVACLCRVYE